MEDIATIAAKEKRTLYKVRSEISETRSLFFFFLLLVAGAGRFAFCRALFFHRLLGFVGLLGAGFGALFALFLLDLLRAQQLDVDRLAAVATAEALADDPQIAAFAVAVARRDRVKKPVHGFASHQKTGSQPASGHVAALAQGDHLFHIDRKSTRLN